MLAVQNRPVTSDCDSDIMGLCLRQQGLDSFAIGQVKACLVDLGVPSDPSIVLAAEVSLTEYTCCCHVSCGMTLLLMLSCTLVCVPVRAWQVLAAELRLVPLSTCSRA